MKKPLLIAACMLLVFTVTFGQKPKIHSYYNQYWREVKTADQAVYYRVVEGNKGNFHVKDYYITGELQSEFNCTAVTPKLEFDSELTLLYKNGKPSQIGKFKNEEPYGRHQYFYESGNKQKEITHRDGKHIYHQYWNEDGIPLLTNGSGTFKTENAQIGPVYSELRDSVVVASYYINREDTIFVKPEQLPEYVGGHEALVKDLTAQLVYPKSARKSGKEGTVYIRFIITKAGTMKDCEIVRGVDAAIDAEALRVVSKYLPHWKPGTFQGRPVNVSFVLPVKFNLKGWSLW